MAKKTIADLKDLHGKRVLVRVDFNVPQDEQGNITNDRRIRAALPTLRAVLGGGGCALVMSHLGRPKGDPKKDAIFRMEKVAQRLGQLLGKPVHNMAAIVGPEVRAAVQQLKAGDVLLLENVRFHPGEELNDDALGEQLGALADVYVNDAFGTCHRKHASMHATPAAMKGKPRVVGFLVAKELEILNRLLASPARPLLGVLGGAKVSDKIGFVRKLLERVDGVLIGGAMAYTFLKAQGKGIGGSKAEADKLDVARELLALGQGKILLPVDHLVVQKLDAPQTARIVDGEIPDGWIGVDIGPRTSALYAAEIGKAKTVLWNGPMGKFEDEPFSKGTRAVAEALSTCGAITVVGGGETAEAVEEFSLADTMTHVSTGGGAFLEYFEGKPFPPLEQID
jgi:phosphoglycerate kinase